MSKYISNTSKIKMLAKKALQNSGDRLAKDLIDQTKQNAETLKIRDTGYYIDESWKIEKPTPSTWRVGSEATYGAMQEWGTYKMAARPHFNPARLKIQRTIPLVVKEEFGKLGM